MIDRSEHKKIVILKYAGIKDYVAYMRRKKKINIWKLEEVKKVLQKLLT